VSADARIRVVTAGDARDLAAARQLFEEYAEWLLPFITHSTLAAELESLPTPFVAPQGRLLVGALEPGGAACGVVGIKRHSDEEAEIKRLFVRDECRGSGLGRALFSAALDAACEMGYAEALVSTVPSRMPEAAAMYERIGFVPTRRFEDHTHANVDIRYLRLDLGEWFR
jgi:putative acetyltransferase